MGQEHVYHCLTSQFPVPTPRKGAEMEICTTLVWKWFSCSKVFLFVFFLNLRLHQAHLRFVSIFTTLFSSPSLDSPAPNLDWVFPPLCSKFNLCESSVVYFSEFLVFYVVFTCLKSWSLSIFTSASLACLTWAPTLVFVSCANSNSLCALLKLCSSWVVHLIPTFGEFLLACKFGLHSVPPFSD